MFREDVMAALGPVADKHGLEISVRNIRYDTTDFTATMKVTKKEVGGLPAEEAAFNRYCKFYGFGEDDYGVMFRCKKEQYRLTGFNPNANKYSVIAKRMKDDAEFGFTAKDVKDFLAKKEN